MAEVLIADDSAFMRNLLREILEEDHTIVGEVENGVEAVEVFTEEHPDLVMMDIVMPIRDGIEATDGYITKPFQKPSVMEAIQDVVPS